MPGFTGIGPFGRGQCGRRQGACQRYNSAPGDFHGWRNVQASSLGSGGMGRRCRVFFRGMFGWGASGTQERERELRAARKRLLEQELKEIDKQLAATGQP